MKKIIRLLGFVIIFTWAVLSLFPIYWMFTTALKSGISIIKIPPEWFPENPTFNNFDKLFTITPIFRWIINTLIMSTGITLGCVLFDSMAGYALAKKRFIGRDLIFWIILGCLMIPFQVRIVPLFILVSKLHWINRYYGLIIPMMASAFGTFLMRQFISTLPTELIDSAKIDGCGELRIFFSVILPLIKPALAVLTILIFTASWNSLLWPLIATNSAEMRTLPVGLATLQLHYIIDYGMMMAGATVCSLPVIICFFILQRYFISGLTVGALKG